MRKLYQPYFVDYPWIEEDARRIEEATSEMCYTSLTRYHEAVIRTDRYASILKDKFEHLMLGTTVKFSTVVQLFNFLNKQFEAYMIYFKYVADDVPEYESGIFEMRLNPINKQIVVMCNYNFLIQFNERNPELLETFYELIAHELVHRGKSLLASYKSIISDFDKFINSRKSIQQSSSLSSKDKEFLSAKLYLSRKDELMAYANQIVEELRFYGFSDKYIIEKAKKFDISSDEAVAIENYNMYFDKNNEEDYKVLRQLYFYIIRYITGEEKHNFII